MAEYDPGGKENETIDGRSNRTQAVTEGIPFPSAQQQFSTSASKNNKRPSPSPNRTLQGQKPSPSLHVPLQSQRSYQLLKNLPPNSMPTVVKHYRHGQCF
ncbi:hypothetical protein TNCV_4707701 [Trichonephila clavipes]|nr:hypothetical protein TNCV_4707701 [Trichonephila clavipes]